MTKTIDLLAIAEDVAERLNDEAMRLQGRGIDRGCVDSSLNGSLARDAVDLIERLSAALRAMEASNG